MCRIYYALHVIFVGMRCIFFFKSPKSPQMLCACAYML